MTTTRETTEVEPGSTLTLRERWGPAGDLLGRAGAWLATPSAALAAIAVIVLVMSWQFITDASRAVPALDTAWYQWRVEYLLENDPGSLIAVEGARGALAGGYRVAEPVLAALMRTVGGVAASVPTVILSVGFRILAAVGMAAFAWRYRRSWTLFYVTLLTIPPLFMLQRFFGFMDNFFSVALMAGVLLLMDRMRVSRVAWVMATLFMFLSGLSHPTTLAVFLVSMFAIAVWHFLRGRFSFRVALDSYVAPVLWSGLVAVIAMVAFWMVGLWGPSAGLNEAAVPPPQDVDYFVNRSLNVLRSMSPLTLLPIFAVGLVALIVTWVRRQERFEEITLAWDLPLAGMFGFLLGAAYPYFRFFNATLAPLVTVAVGFAALIALALRFTRRPLAQVAPLVASAIVVGILLTWWVTGFGAWNRAGTWLTPEVRVTGAAADAYLDAAPEGTQAVFLADARPGGAVVPYGEYKDAVNGTYAGLGGEHLDRVAIFFGGIEDLRSGQPTTTGDEIYDELSRDSFEEANALLEDGPTVVFVPVVYNEEGSPNADLGQACPECVSLTDDDLLFVSPDLSTAPLSEEAMEVAGTAAAEAGAFAESPPGPFENLGGTILSILGLAVLFLLPGWILFQALPDRDPVEGLALVPLMSIGLVTTVGVFVVAITRSPYDALLGWVTLAVAVVVAAGFQAAPGTPGRTEAD